MKESHQPAAALQNRLPTSFWIKGFLGLTSAALLALTLVAPDWIELLLGIAPDEGSGASEWGFSLSLLTVSVLMFESSWRTWRKHARLTRST
jgi:hypothetical protein